MSKGGGSNTTVQKADPWGGVQPHLKSLYGKTGEALNTETPFFPGQTYADFNPLQMAGMQGQIDYAQGLSPQIGQYQNTLNDYMRAPLDITNDPAVRNMMAANESSVTDTLTKKWLPSIGRGAVAAGQYGGSRQALAEGQAIGEASKALSNANAQTAMGAYDTASKLAGFAGSALPQALQFGFMPSQVSSEVGGKLQGMEQQGINEAMQRYYYPQQSTWENLGKAASIYSGAQPYGTSSTTQPGGSKAADAIGGGLLGYSLGRAVLPGLGMSAGMGGALGGGLGAILPFLSDRRAKKNIVPLGNRGTQYEWYEFEYKNPRHGTGKQIGVMADEVEKINPAAVTEIDGFKAVYYGAL